MSEESRERIIVEMRYHRKSEEWKRSWSSTVKGYGLFLTFGEDERIVRGV